MKALNWLEWKFDGGKEGRERMRSVFQQHDAQCPFAAALIPIISNFKRSSIRLKTLIGCRGICGKGKIAFY